MNLYFNKVGYTVYKKTHFQTGLQIQVILEGFGLWIRTLWQFFFKNKVGIFLLIKSQIFRICIIYLFICLDPGSGS